MSYIVIMNVPSTQRVQDLGTRGLPLLVWRARSGLASHAVQVLHGCLGKPSRAISPLSDHTITDSRPSTGRRHLLLRHMDCW
jgi:hypothetical protein